MRRFRYLWLAAPLLLVLLLLPASSVYYHSTAGEGCARCHEIRESFDLWSQSTHRSVSCSACHGDSLTTDVAFHMSNARRLVKHMRGDVPEQIRIKDLDVVRMLERCKSCHRQEFADWQAGPHSSVFSKIFLDQKHNHQRLLMTIACAATARTTRAASANWSRPSILKVPGSSSTPPGPTPR